MEIEIKYGVPSEEVLRRIAAAGQLDGYRIGELRDRQVSDRYLDTADLCFYRAGYVCRARSVEGRMMITIKSIAGAPETGSRHEREEYETSADGDQPDSWAGGEAPAFAARISQGQPLEELFSLSQIRRVGSLFKDGRAVAELSLDHVMIEADGELTTFLELEAELLPGGEPADADRLAEHLESEYHLQPEPRSKFERALERLRPDLLRQAGGAVDKKVIGIEAQDSMQAAARKAIAYNFARMEKKEEGTITGEDPEELHQMRVATRRMRGAARIFAPYSDDGTLRKLGRGLRDAARCLGGVRDFDVQLEHAREFRQTLPEAEREGFERLLASWEEEREAARRRMLMYLESKDYARLKKSLRKFVEAEDPAAPALDEHEIRPYQMRHRAGSDIWSHYEEVWAFDVVAAEASEPQLHQLRISCKYLRYTLEFFEEVLPPGARGVIAQLTAAQDHLGLLHDAAVTIERLEDYLKKGKKSKKRSGADLAGARIYLAERRESIENLRGSFPTLWSQLGGRGFREQLAALLAGVGAGS